MKNYKRLFKFLKGHRHLFFVSIVMILLIQSLNFISPLIVKTILDDCLLGIEYTWIEVENEDEYTIQFDGSIYKQERHKTNEDIVIKHASIILYKTGVYFIDEKVQIGQRKVENDVLTITVGEVDYYYYGLQKLSVEEVMGFYQPIYSTLLLFIILLFIKTILVIFFSYIQHISTSRVINWLARDGRTVAMRAVEGLPISEFESEPAGKMASRITVDVDGLIIMYRQLISLFTNAAVSFILAYVGMFILDSELNGRFALLTLLIYPFIYIWIRFFLKRLKKIAVKFNETRSLLTAKINEIINGIHILQIFNFKKQTVNEFNEINQIYRNEQLKDVKLGITAGWNMINVVKGLITTLIVAYFGWQRLSFSGMIITAGSIYAYNEYLLKLIDPVHIVFTQISEFQHSHVRIERIHKLIEGKVEEDEKTMIPKYHGDILFDNVWFSYVDNEYVLKGVSLEIAAGQMVGLVGATGSGKSSLMNLLLRFYDITDLHSGKIYVDGVDINTFSKRTYREHIGIVLQEPVLFKGTIASNIRFGKEISDEEVEQILISIGGDKIIKKFPLGINQPITRTGINMSSGEKQIIALARAIVHDPAILIMDEATSHIDTETEEMIKKALEVVCQKRTVIIIAHRLSTIFNADKIFVLHEGLKVEEGTHQQLLDNNSIYANIYRAQLTNTFSEN